MNKLDNPKVGEVVLFDSFGSTYTGRISRIDAKGRVMVEPETSINGPVQMQNLRRRESAVAAPSTDEQFAMSIKTDGRFANKWYRQDRKKYDAAMVLIRSGALDKKKSS
jgi:hypothetical protein